jgi:ribosomal protein L37AE/L43A
MGLFSSAEGKKERIARIERKDKEILDRYSVKCPSCGNTALPSVDTTDWYDCTDCKNSFQSKPHYLITYPSSDSSYVRDPRGVAGKSKITISEPTSYDD